MLLRRHKDIIAVKGGPNHHPVAFHARNFEIAQISEEAWTAMAPTTFNNSFPMSLEESEVSSEADAFTALESWNQEINADFKLSQLKFGIKSLTINITQICNLHCVYCAAGGDGTYGDPIAKISVEKVLPQIKFFLDKLNQGDVFHVTFLGGEPLLYPQAIKLIADYVNSTALEKGLRSNFTVITNGTLISDDNLKLLSSIKASITVSIDGPPEIHDRVRPQKNGQGSAVAVIEGLKKIISHKKDLGRVLLHAVFSKNNLEVEKAYLFFSQFDVDAFEFTFDVTEADEVASHKFMSEMAKVADLAFKSGGESALRKIQIFDNYFRSLDRQQGVENYCGAGKSLLSFDSNGKLYSCPLEVGKKNEYLGEAQDLNMTALQDLQSPLIEKNNCASCWARHLCGGGCLFNHKSLTGNKHKKHITFCERTRYLIAIALLYYERCRN